MTALEGKWVLDKSENFEEYMKEVGVGLLTRKAAANIKNSLVVKINGNKWEVAQLSTFKNTELHFTLGEEFDETTPDGRKMRTKIHFEGDKLIQEQKATKDGEKDSTIERFVEGDRLVCILKAGCLLGRSIPLLLSVHLPILSFRMSILLGGAACGIAALFFGSMFVPIKRYNAGDGIFVQWIMGNIIFGIGFIVYAYEEFPPFYPLAMLGGMLWTIGNATAIPIIRRLGMALGILIWNTTNCITGWACGIFGLFHTVPRPPASALLNYLGLGCVILGGIIFSQVRSGPSNKAEKGTEAEKVALNSPSSRTEEEKEDVEEEAAPWGGRPLGFGLALIAGVFYGLTFMPVVYIQDNVDGVPQNGLPYVFSHYTGIILTASLIFLVYSLVHRGRPALDGQLVIPACAGGALWAIAQTAFFVANSTLSQTVTFPIITMLPGCVASAWSIFYFKEITGRRNFLLMGIAMGITLTGSILVGLSKDIAL